MYLDFLLDLFSTSMLLSHSFKYCGKHFDLILMKSILEMTTIIIFILFLDATCKKVYYCYFTAKTSCNKLIRFFNECFKEIIDVWAPLFYSHIQKQDTKWCAKQVFSPVSDPGHLWSSKFEEQWVWDMTPGKCWSPQITCDFLYRQSLKSPPWPFIFNWWLGRALPLNWRGF